MKILQINSVCGYGSTGRIATDLYDVLEKEGHECCIAYGRGNAPQGYNVIKIGNEIDIVNHIMKTRLFDLHGFGSKKATMKFINQIEDYKPDIIHLHNIHGYYINIEILFEYLSTLTIPIIWLLHDQWAFSGHSAYFKINNDGSIPKENLDFKQRLDYPKSYFLDNSYKNFLRKKELFTKVKNMTIVTPSYWLENLVRNSFLSTYDIKVIQNGIDLNIFRPYKSGFRNKYKLEDKKIILGVANIWEERKGLKYFDQLADQLEDSFKIVLVGVDKRTKKKINSNILCISKTENVKELAEIYASANIFLNPTLEDNFPTTNIEALACGTPVITFNTGGSPESLNEKTGKVIENGDFERLYDFILNFNYEKENIQNCRKQAQNFEKNDVYNKYLSLYLSVIKKNTK